MFSLHMVNLRYGKTKQTNYFLVDECTHFTIDSNILKYLVAHPTY